MFVIQNQLTSKNLQKNIKPLVMGFNNEWPTFWGSDSGKSSYS